MTTITRVLFVDDEPQALKALRRSLRKRDLPWSMKFATSGREALEQLNRSRFDVIVSDLRMPVMSGEELLKRVSEEFPHVVQVILSGADESELDAEMLATRPPFLSKPCSAEKLIATIGRGIFLREFFRRGALNRLIDSLADLTSIPEMQIKIRPAADLGQPGAKAVAEIICHDLGLRLRVPVGTAAGSPEPALEGAAS